MADKLHKVLSHSSNAGGGGKKLYTEEICGKHRLSSVSGDVSAADGGAANRHQSWLAVSSHRHRKQLAWVTQSAG